MGHRGGGGVRVGAQGVRPQRRIGPRPAPSRSAYRPHRPRTVGRSSSPRGENPAPTVRASSAGKGADRPRRVEGAPVAGVRRTRFVSPTHCSAGSWLGDRDPIGRPMPHTLVTSPVSVQKVPGPGPLGVPGLPSAPVVRADPPLRARRGAPSRPRRRPVAPSSRRPVAPLRGRRRPVAPSRGRGRAVSRPRRPPSRPRPIRARPACLAPRPARIPRPQRPRRRAPPGVPRTARPARIPRPQRPRRRAARPRRPRCRRQNAPSR
jgi:hypothetical protein